jgi:ABC-2 type transport system ATP-binding protein
MRSGHAATAIIPVLSCGVGAREATRYALRLASFQLQSSDLGRAALGVVTPRSPASAVLVGLLSGRIAPAYGQLRVLDHDLSTAAGRMAVRPQVGIASRTARVWPTITIRGLVERAARRSGQPGSDRRLLVAAILDRLALMPWAQVPLRAAPDLVTRRARLAAACVHEPRLLIIDGLFDYLGPRDRTLLADVVREFKRDTSIIAVGADADTLLLFCDQVLMLANGIVIGRQPVSQPSQVSGLTTDLSGPGRPGRQARLP